jgi:hypothetical protein
MPQPPAAPAAAPAAKGKDNLLCTTWYRWPRRIALALAQDAGRQPLLELAHKKCVSWLRRVDNQDSSYRPLHSAVS